MNSTFSRSLRLAIAVAAAVVLPTAASASMIELTLDYSNTVGASVHFDGKSHFWFAPSHGTSFKVTSTGDAQGLLGSIGGTFTIGTITTAGGISTAPVTGTGTFVIHDGFGFDLTGSLALLDITQMGTLVTLNQSGATSLTNLTYGGSNPLLVGLAQAPGTALNAVSFTFIPRRTLASLKTSKADTSFAGSVYAQRIPDGGDTLLMLGIALAGCAAFARRRLGAAQA